MKQPLRRALQRAGISREEGWIGRHDLRHTYASHLAMRGIPLKVVQELMGRVTIELTERSDGRSAKTPTWPCSTSLWASSPGFTPSYRNRLLAGE
jgi:integrase